MSTKPELKHIPVDQLVPNGWNPQHMGEAEMNRLVDEIKENGCIVPLQVVPQEDGLYRIIGGEHRWKASQQAGLEDVPCAVLTGKRWSNEDLQKFVTVRLNAISGKPDVQLFAKLHKEMVDKFGDDAVQTMFGYTDTRAFQKLVGSMKRGVRQALPKAAQEEFDEKAKEARTVADLSDIVQMLFAKYGDTIPKSFMVFTYGKQEHVYVQMNPKMKRALDKALNYCRESGEDLNAFFAPVLDAAAREAAKEFSKKKEAGAPAGAEAV